MRFLYKCRIQQSKENVFTLNCNPLNNPKHKRKTIVFHGDVNKLKVWLRKIKAIDNQSLPNSIKNRTYQQMIDQALEGTDPYVFIWSNMLNGTKVIVKEKKVMNKLFFESKLNAKDWLIEAFSAGKANFVVEKLGKILSRRIGIPIKFAETPLEYENSYGQFAGYMGNASNNFFIKINFLLSKSDSIVSFDVYKGKSLVKPSYTVSTEGLNIVQIVNLIEENLIDTDLADLNESKIKERGRPSQGEIEDYYKMIDLWLKEEPDAFEWLQDMQLDDLYSKKFKRFSQGKPRYEKVKPYFFKKVIKGYLFSKNLTNKHFRKRKKGSAERAIENPVLQDELNSIVDDISAQEKFEMLKGIVTQATLGNINSVIVAGSPGSGKTHETIKVINDNGLVEGTDYKVYRGGISGTEELIRILYNSQQNNIGLLVFDDFDSIWKNAEQKNILKSALDVGDRIITYLSKSKSNMLKDIPPQFEFNSSIIFITNLPTGKLDSAIKSRSAVIEINISNAEMVNRIEDKLEKFMPEVSIDIKKQALEFLESIHEGISAVDFRALRNVIVAIQCGGSLWKKMALMMMTSVG